MGRLSPAMFQDNQIQGRNNSLITEVANDFEVLSEQKQDFNFGPNLKTRMFSEESKVYSHPYSNPGNEKSLTGGPEMCQKYCKFSRGTSLGVMSKVSP